MNAVSSANSRNTPVRRPIVGPPDTSEGELDAKVQRLRSEARLFARLPPREKARLLRETRKRFSELSERMVELGCLAKGIDPSSPLAGEEWFSGPAISLRGLRLFAEALDDIQEGGAPRIERSDISTLANGRTSVRVTPRGFYDRSLFRGWQCEAWLKEPIEAGRSIETQASFYRRSAPEGTVTVVLGAGNVASISVLDVLHHSFVRGAVCLLKLSPVNAYLGPLYEQAFEPLITRGFLAFAYGGADVGVYLCAHALVDAIHITGSAETHDVIVWGPSGAEREARKTSGRPLLDKPVTSELGNISPVLILPAQYSDRELDSVARNIAGMMVQNASFNCNAAKMLVTPRGWSQRSELLSRLGQLFRNIPSRLAYYPGAQARYERLVPASGEATVQRFGAQSDGRLPWTLVSGLDSRSDSALFQIEPFCSILSETEVGGADPVDYLSAATRFVNQKLWGTLNAMLIVPPRLERDARVARSLDDAIVELRYGTVAINLWPAVSYGLLNPPWGGHPSSTLSDVQSGIGWGHDAVMLEGVEKVVLKGPLSGFPEPLWYPGHRHLDDLGRAIARIEAEPKPTRVLGAAWAAIRR